MKMTKANREESIRNTHRLLANSHPFRYMDKNRFIEELLSVHFANIEKMQKAGLVGGYHDLGNAYNIFNTNYQKSEQKEKARKKSTEEKLARRKEILSKLSKEERKALGME
jgi:hypothetical protein